MFLILIRYLKADDDGVQGAEFCKVFCTLLSDRSGTYFCVDLSVTAVVIQVNILTQPTAVEVYFELKHLFQCKLKDTHISQ